MNTDALVRNKSQEVLSTLEEIHEIVRMRGLVKEAMKTASFYNRVYYFFLRIYKTLCFRRERSRLLLLVDSATSEINQAVLLQAGEFFYKLGDRNSALRCFKSVIKDHTCEDRDTCLLALTWRLEIEVEFLLELVKSRVIPDPEVEGPLVELYSLVKRQAPDASPAILENIKDLLVRAKEAIDLIHREIEAEEARMSSDEDL